ncbi:ABC transporter permease [Rhizobium mayense]|uniref:Autoinducer 2 import system permease protein LsrD n=1 Tax=Rhizobium mayense TaxID=1312184 RepID=A0ABT7JRA4_9HYPH|nr:ABC transporter permease [Rhizobium mayense]MDL2398878.1 ABC transporter permease [Rhizobium mayense]
MAIAKANAAVSASSSAGMRAGDIGKKYGIYLFLLVAILVTTAVSPTFLSPANVSNMLMQLAPLAIVVIGQTFVILVRGLDLSVASVMATAAVIATSFNGQNSDAALILLACIGMGAATGLANGLLVTKRNVSPFLATLATMIVLQGFRFAATQGAPSGNVPPIYRLIGSATLSGVPYNLMVMVVLAIIFAVLLHRAAFGRRVYITGGNPITARLVGIAADRVTIICYMICGVLAAVAGLVLSGFVGVVDNFVGRGFELDSIVAAVMGGVALSGGRGTIPGALAGAAILVVLSNAVVMVGMPVQLQIIVKGVVIIVAASLYVRTVR